MIGCRIAVASAAAVMMAAAGGPAEPPIISGNNRSDSSHLTGGPFRVYQPTTVKEDPIVNTRFHAASTLGIAPVVLMAGGKKAPTEEPFEPKLLPSTLGVAVVPDGTEDITVTARDEHGSTLALSVECEDEGIVLGRE